ncbi:MAG: TetR/AcrR family transcriptional regulator, lmrAB and yxaGH operons repressor [Mycobacterium sp.]|nr:TetR/AcrR family transcriptional regulator, lmrAB and yxaGH operons repressor [Mycobacterium sp.]
MAKGEARERMVSTAARLLAEKGPTGASFGDVLRTSGTSRGSTYHHFPQGKREMYAAALDLASQRAFDALEDARGDSAVAIVEKFFVMWRTLLSRSDLKVGCAVLAVAVAGEDQDNVDHAGQIFTTWRAHLASLFLDAGLTRARAESLAATTLASAEGAVAIARAEHSISSFDLVATQVTELVRSASSSPQA